MLSTAFALAALVFAAVAAIAAWLAGRHALALDAAVTSLNKTTLHLKAHTDRVNVLEGRLDRLAGRVYAQARRPRSNGIAPVDDPATADMDPDLLAELALQTAPPVAPGSK